MNPTAEALLELMRQERDDLARQLGAEVAETQRLKRLVKRAADYLESAAELLEGDDEEDDRDAQEFIAELREAVK